MSHPLDRAVWNALNNRLAGFTTADSDARAVRIDPEVTGEQDVEMLEDLVLAAVNEALRRSKELANGRMGQLTGGMGSLGLF